MTAYQLAMLALAVGGFTVTIVTGIIALTRAVEKIKLDISEKLAIERLDTTEKLAVERATSATTIAHLRDDFLRDQKAQDHNFGEVGMAIRQYVADVEKKVQAVEREMHEIEIWGRDNYAIKADMKAILDEIRAVRADVKADFRDLNQKIDDKH